MNVTRPRGWRIATLSSFLAAVAIGLAPPALAGGAVYVPMGSTGAIAVIDAARDEVIGEITDAKEAHGLAATADGKYLVAGRFGETSEAESFLSVFRTADNTLARRIRVPGAVHHMAVTPDGRHAIATHSNGDTVSIVDLNGLGLLKTLKTGPSPNYAVAARNAKRIYVSNSGGDTVSEIDTESWTVSRDIVVGEDPGHMALSPDGGTLYVNNGYAGTIAAVSLQEGAVVKTFEVGGSLHGIDISGDGKRLYVSDMDGNRLVEVNPDSGEMRDVPLVPSPFHVTAIQGSGKIYVSSIAETKIWVVDQGSLMLRGEIPLPGNGHQMVLIGE